MAKDLGCSVAELIASRELRLKINPERYLSPTVAVSYTHLLKTWMPESVDFFTDFPSSPIKAGFVYEYDVEANINMIKQMYPGTKTVSYTHLDVYKRQVGSYLIGFLAEGCYISR